MDPFPASSPPPAKDPVQGAGGVDYLNWAAIHMADDEFSDTYAHRADHLLNLHGDLLDPETAERLEDLI